MTIEAKLDQILENQDRLIKLTEDQGRTVTPASFNINETVIVLGVNRGIVRRLIAEGHLLAATYPGMTEQRIPRTSIDAFLAASTVHPTTTLEIAS